MNLHDKLLNFYRRGAAEPEVIIVGNQKSGTTAIAKLLGYATGKTVQNDIPTFWPPAVYQYLKGQRDVKGFVNDNKRKFSFSIVKEPNLTFFLGQLLKLFPSTKYVFVLRDPRDNIRSILNRRGIPGDMDELDMIKFNIDPMKTYIGNSEMWRHEDGHYISQQALKWLACLNCYEEVKNYVILLRYEDFNANKEDVIRNLSVALGLKVLNSIDHLKDISFQPKGNSSVPWRTFFGDKNLRRIEQICQGAMESYNYFPTK